MAEVVLLIAVAFLSLSGAVFLVTLILLRSLSGSILIVRESEPRIRAAARLAWLCELRITVALRPHRCTEDDLILSKLSESIDFGRIPEENLVEKNLQFSD